MEKIRQGDLPFYNANKNPEKTRQIEIFVYVIHNQFLYKYSARKYDLNFFSSALQTSRHGSAWYWCERHFHLSKRYIKTTPWICMEKRWFSFLFLFHYTRHIFLKYVTYAVQVISIHLLTILYFCTMGFSRLVIIKSHRNGMRLVPIKV